MLSLAMGHSTSYLTDSVAGGREGYYSGAVDAGEPPGRWYGQGAADLGLTGEVNAELMKAIYGELRDPRDPRTHDPATVAAAAGLGGAHQRYKSPEERYEAALAREPHAGPERRVELRADAERESRESLGFIDATFSAPKSVSVLGVAFERKANDARAVGDLGTAAAWAAMHKAIEDSVMVGARATIDYLEREAGYGRAGKAGARFVDAHRWTVAQFLQHDSRARDPQLHVHQAILNRAQCADGRWRALDSRGIHQWKAAAGAVGERAMEAHLSRTLGVTWVARTTENGAVAREVAGVSREMMELFSERRHEIVTKAEELLAQYRENGREPSAREVTKIYQQATLATRQAKSHDGETAAQKLERWTEESRTVSTDALSKVAEDVIRTAQDTEPAQAEWSPEDVIARALASAGKGESTWTRASFIRALSDALPANLGVSGDEARDVLEKLADEGLPQATQTTVGDDVASVPPALRLANGDSPYVRPGSARYSTEGQIAAERVLRAAAVERGALSFTREEADGFVQRFAEAGVELGADQAAALRGVLTSGARLEVLSSPAGTGKSFAVGAITEAWREQGQRTMGLATSERATRVLTEEGVPARNVAAWLATQERLAQGRAIDGDEEFRVLPGSLVVLDEASMTTTDQVRAVLDACRAVDAKLLMTGDARQLSAVGPGGALADMGERALRYELAEVRRFSAEWEKAASLGLRQGDAAALEEYRKHGRIQAGGTAEQAEAKATRAFLADTLAGKESLLLVPTNEQARRVNAAMRDKLVSMGRVSVDGVLLGREGTVAGVGDLVQGRRNGWELRDFDSNDHAAPTNRTTYRVDALRADGGLTVTPVGGGRSIELSAEYVASDLALGYASTVHAALGRTVDTAHSVVGPGMDAEGLYVTLTRGRDKNTAWAITKTVPRDAEAGKAHDVAERSAVDVLGDVLRPDAVRDATHGTSALTQQEQSETDAASMAAVLAQLSDSIGKVSAGRVSVLLDQLTADGALTEEQRVAIAADEAYGSLERLLRTAEVAGHAPADVLAAAVADRSLDDAQHPAQALHWRVRESLRDELAPKISSYADLIPSGVAEEDRAALQLRAEAADDRRRALGEATAVDAPRWAVEALGPVPDDAVARAEWEQRAGWAAASREASGHDDELDALGNAPPAGLVEKHAAWMAGHEALGLPDRGPEERQASEGLLRARVAAYERELNWAPPYVADQLEATTSAADRRREDATVWGQRADATEDATEAARLREEAQWAAAEAEALAQKAQQLEFVDTERAEWFVETAVTRDLADRSRIELASRGVDLDNPPDRTTTREWLDAHAEEQAEADEVREITDEAELTDADDAQLRAEAAEIAADYAQRNPDPHGIELATPDIREVSVPPAYEFVDDPDPGRIPSAAECAEGVAQAHRALEERMERDAWEAAQVEDERHAQSHRLSDWAAHDAAQQQAEQQAEQHDAFVDY